MMGMRHRKGFTLLELVVTVTVLAVVTTIAIPSFVDVIRNNRLTTQANDFIGTLRFARAEAIKRGERVDVVANASVGTNEWGGGWRVVVASSAEVLRQHAALEAGNTLDSTIQNASTYQFLPGGDASPSDTLELCDSRTGETGRGIVITAIGRTTLSNPAPTCD